MKQNLKKGKVKGTVLFTVITVMLVMVVFLMSTLILTSSANRRSYYTYFESQSQYAAQAALSAVTNSAYTDADFHNWVVAAATDGAAPLPITVDFTGSHIQFTNGNDSVACTVEKVPSSYVWDDATQAVHEQRSWRITATASVGNGRNVSEYTVCNYIYENFHIDDPALLNSVQNSVTNNLFSWTMGVTPSTPTGTSSLVQGTFSLGASGATNNVISLGPQYSGMSNLPLGRILYDDPVASAGYTLDTINDNYAVGNVLYVSSLSATVLRYTQFQRPSESAIYYGNIYSNNKGNGGFYWEANIPATELAAYGGVIPYNSLPYVYVDGSIISSGGGTYVGCGNTADADIYPVNLYCGGVYIPNANDELVVYGDAYMYDRDLDSVWCATAYTDLARFVHNNVTQANMNHNTSVGGNLISNNRTLTLGGNGAMEIEGNLIYTNPYGMLNLTNTVVVGTTANPGKLICAGQLLGTNLLTCYEVITPTSYSRFENGVETPWQLPDGYTYESFFAAQCDANYAAYTGGGYDVYAQTADNRSMSLFPFNYRLDEINEIYYRWDLKSQDPNTAASNAAYDPYVQESIAAGHSWQDSSGAWNVKDFTITRSEPTYEIITNTNDPRWDWSAASWSAEYGNHMRVSTGAILTSETWYVPFTTPVDINNVIVPAYQPVSPDTAASVMTGSSSFQIETVSDFANLMVSPDDFNSDNRPTYVEGVPILYHTNGSQDSATVNAYVINNDCYIDLNDGYNNSTIVIDPRMNSHFDSTRPLCIVFRGTTIANCNTNIIINNSASYATDYKSATYLESIADANGNPSYAGRREVFIFFEDGFGAAAQPFKLYCSGAYGQVASKSFVVVSNPIYPDNGTWGSIGDGYIRYSYELVPNTVIFGESGGTFTFKNAALINAEMLMANSTINNDNSSLFAAAVEYREEWYSNPYTTPTTPMINLGTIMCTQLVSSPNIAMTVYIGDANRVPPSLAPVYNTSSTTNNSSKLGQDYNDYFSNDHQGAS